MYKVLIQFDDRYFIRAFSNYVSLNCADIEFICFTKAETALDYIKNEKKRIDVYIGERTLLAQIESGAKAIASDETSYIDPNEVKINIYQAGKAILSDIRSVLSTSRGESVGKGQCKVVAVFSCQGGSGKSTLAYALALAAVRDGKQAIYLNLELYPHFGQMYDVQFETQMDDLLFAIKDGRDVMPVVLEALERNAEGVMVLPPFHNVEDLLSLTQEEVKKLLHTLSASAGTDYLIVDLPSGWQGLNHYAVMECSTLLQVYEDTRKGRMILSKAEDELYQGENGVKGIVITVLNKCKGNSGEDGIDEKIPFSEGLYKENLIADVLERNPAFYQGCLGLLRKIG